MAALTGAEGAIRGVSSVKEVCSVEGNSAKASRFLVCISEKLYSVARTVRGEEID